MQKSSHLPVLEIGSDWKHLHDDYLNSWFGLNENKNCFSEFEDRSLNWRDEDWGSSCSSVPAVAVDDDRIDDLMKGIGIELNLCGIKKETRLDCCLD